MAADRAPGEGSRAAHRRVGAVVEPEPLRAPQFMPPFRDDAEQPDGESSEHAVDAFHGAVIEASGKAFVMHLE